MTLRALVTAGGTSEPIDDVRVITNLSSGRFGAAIANALAARGVEVTVLGSRGLARQPEWLDDRVTLVPFRSFADLDRGIAEQIEAGPPDLLFMAAAVSDYSPVPTEGKIRSTSDELVIRMTKNPKILSTLRERCGVETFLVGFKLLSSVSEEELVDTARGQIRKAHLNLCLANDLEDLRDGQHPAWMVTPEGGAIPVSGTKAQTARQLVDFVLLRQGVRWSRSVRTAESPPDAPHHDEAATLLQFAQRSGLLPDVDGNITHRASGNAFWATPRGVNKSTVTPDQLLHVEAELDDYQVRFAGAAKPSIDSSVHGWLYHHLPELGALLHCHEAFVDLDAVTDLPWPCGTREEAEEIYRTLLRTSRPDGRFALMLVHHGYLLGLLPGDADRLSASRDEATEGWRAHLDDIGQLDTLVHADAVPVFGRGTVLGLVGRFREGWSDTLPTGATIWLHPDARGSGLGDLVLQQLEERGERLVANDQCEVENYYVARGWRPLARDGELLVLEPPTVRDDAVPAASLALVCDGRILLGRRKVGAWGDHWAFPGGKQDPDEALIDTAVRELREETGISCPVADPIRETVVHVSTADGPLYRVHNFAVEVLSPPVPEETTELEGRWFTWEEVATLRPMAAGTRRVVHALRRHFGV